MGGFPFETKTQMRTVLTGQQTPSPSFRYNSAEGSASVKLVKPLKEPSGLRSDMHIKKQSTEVVATKLPCYISSVLIIPKVREGGQNMIFNMFLKLFYLDSV